MIERKQWVPAQLSETPLHAHLQHGHLNCLTVVLKNCSRTRAVRIEFSSSVEEKSGPRAP